MVGVAMWAATASGAPGMLPYPPQVLEKGVANWGAGGGYGRGEQVDTGVGFAGWSRYGLARHVEAFGGAWLTVPFGWGVHGGLRATVGNRDGADGWGASAGITVGAGGRFNVAVPLEVGPQFRSVRAWVGAQPAVFPLVVGSGDEEVLGVSGFEVSGLGGVEVDVDGFGISVTGGGGSAGSYFGMLGVTSSL